MIGLIILDVILLIVLTGADLLTKHLATGFLSGLDGYYEVIKDVLAFRYSENTGAAFGFLSEHTVFLSVFVALILCILIGFLVWNIVGGKYKQRGSVLMHVSVIMVVAGGLGNLYDRIVLGYVRDFIEYTFIYVWTGERFPICNVADIFLCIGVAALIAYILFFYGRKSCGEINNITNGAKSADVKEQEGNNKHPVSDAKKCEKCDNNSEAGCNNYKEFNTKENNSLSKRSLNG